MVILYVYFRLVKEITNLQSLYAYKKFQMVCEGKNLCTPSYTYMRIFLLVNTQYIEYLHNKTQLEI
jgi:hypothetical protein